MNFPKLSRSGSSSVKGSSELIVDVNKIGALGVTYTVFSSVSISFTSFAIMLMFTPKNITKIKDKVVTVIMHCVLFIVLSRFFYLLCGIMSFFICLFVI